MDIVAEQFGLQAGAVITEELGKQLLIENINACIDYCDFNIAMNNIEPE